MQLLVRTDLLVLSVLGRDSVCKLVWSEVVTPIVAPPRAIWLPVSRESCEKTALTPFQKLSPKQTWLKVIVHKGKSVSRQPKS